MRIRVLVSATFALAVSSCVMVDVDLGKGAGSGGTSASISVADGPGFACQPHGILKYNGVKVSNEPIKCFSTYDYNTYVSTTTGSGDHAGEFTCPYPYLGDGNVWFEARGDSSDYCKDAAGNVKYCNGLTECNPNVSGCAQPSVSWSVLLAPAFLRLRRRRRGSLLIAAGAENPRNPRTHVRRVEG